jgi:hypothetical protein
MTRTHATSATTALLAAAAAVLLAFTAPPAQSQTQTGQTEQTQPVANEFDVYVDLATGFSYIKTPVGWRYIRQLDAEQMKQLHPTTLTTLAPADAAEVRLAYERATATNLAGKPAAQH